MSMVFAIGSEMSHCKFGYLFLVKLKCYPYCNSPAPDEIITIRSSEPFCYVPSDSLFRYTPFRIAQLRLNFGNLKYIMNDEVRERIINSINVQSARTYIQFWSFDRKKMNNFV